MTLIELLIAIAITGIMGVAILTFMSSLYATQATTYHLAQRTEKALIMKAALNNTVSSAGSIAAPTLSSTGNTVANGSTPFNILGAVQTFLFGNCPNTGILGDISGFLNNTTNNFLNDIFNGGYDSQHTTATEGNVNLNAVTVPATPIAVTASSISFYWLAVHVNGGSELCHGTLQLNGKVLNYSISGSANNGYSNCGSPNRSNQDSTAYPVGSGWSFSGPIQDTSCLGDAYPDTTPDAIVATAASAHGLLPTKVTVCLPAM
ncbi:type II secretion system protein [Acidithiobacillus sp. CV18-2]|nr:type II secretion system protein [Acidithiobacillus sp. CV18-3]MBU2758357.1 type II secretion system protein [Acidithiobacillus sp. BN09-2]MBU2778218.1 type II secretion system protein [Acidithiobacillus sp. CV18-2]MBU2799091.1 type II secretion system protein [Acidithiobacillus sp. VAN18-4]